jgi:hypothetical protein
MAKTSRFMVGTSPSATLPTLQKIADLAFIW